VNPVREIKTHQEQPRKRYLSDSEYAAIRSKARPWLALMMDLAYLTGQRPGDVRTIKRSQIKKDCIDFEQQKTGNRVRIDRTQDIDALLRQIDGLRTIQGIYLFHSGKGRPYSYYTVVDAFRRACVSAGITGAQFRDIRAKAATDADAAGLNATKLLGHSDANTTKRYMRKRRIVKALGPASIGQLQD